MVASYIHFDSSRTVLDNSVRGYFTRYNSPPTPLWYLFCRSFRVFISVSCLRKTSLSAVVGVLEVVIDFTLLLNSRVIFAIRRGWKILRVVLLRSPLILHHEIFSSGPIYWSTYHFLFYSIVSKLFDLSTIVSVSYTYTMTIAVPSLSTLQNLQRPVLHWLNPILRVMLLMHYLNKLYAACSRPQINLSSHNISSYL